MWQQIFFGIALIAGVWILAESIRSAAQFDAFCHRLAALHGEHDEAFLASDAKDESYGPYRMKIHNELVKPSKSDFIPKQLESEASELGHRMALARDFLFIYLAAMALGLLYMAA